MAYKNLNISQRYQNISYSYLLHEYRNKYRLWGIYIYLVCKKRRSSLQYFLRCVTDGWMSERSSEIPWRPFRWRHTRQAPPRPDDVFHTVMQQMTLLFLHYESIITHKVAACPSLTGADRSCSPDVAPWRPAANAPLLDHSVFLRSVFYATLKTSDIEDIKQTSA